MGETMSDVISIFKEGFFGQYTREEEAHTLPADVVERHEHVRKISRVLENRFGLGIPPISFRLTGEHGSYFNKNACKIYETTWFGIILPVKLSLSAMTWVMLHEYQHYYQHEVGQYYTRIYYDNNVWHGRLVDASTRNEAEYIQLPWEAEADVFANSNHVAVCSDISINSVIPDKISTVPGRISPVIPGEFVHPSTFSMMKGG